MDGVYDLGLVALSYLIASLAGFVAIEFASRMRIRNANRAPWLIGGALAMGTGIWSMHFVGMTAFTLPVPMSYDGWITLLSWAAAVGVSALALYIVGYGQLKSWTLIVGALIMGFGVCVMHYSGMWAMRMDPGITYKPEIFAASAAIAVVASGAALLIIASLKEVRSWRDVGLRVAAALIMGLAVAGMHYTGMAAAEFANGAMCWSGNALSADVMPWPTTIGTLLILGFGIFFTVMDAMEVTRARRAANVLAARVHDLAFVDRDTGLPNRAWLSQQITERIRTDPGNEFALTTFRVQSHSGREMKPEIVRTAHARVSAEIPEAVLAQTQTEHLVAMIEGSREVVSARCEALFQTLRREMSREGFHLQMKSAHYPTDGENAHWLLLRSAPKS